VSNDDSSMKPEPPHPAVLLTRPRRESRATAHALAKQGIASIRLPLQATRRAPQSAALDQDLGWAATANVHVFVSRAAVVAMLAAAPTWVVAGGALIAVGRATASALQRHGLPATSAPGHAEDSDGVLALSQLHNVQGARVAIWAAPGGRQRIAEVLVERGAAVRVIPVYRRVPQRPRPATLRQLRAAQDHCVLTATSGALLEALDRLLQRQRLLNLRERLLIVASERIAARAGALGYARVRVAAGASAQALIAALGDLRITI